MIVGRRRLDTARVVRVRRAAETEDGWARRGLWGAARMDRMRPDWCRRGRLSRVRRPRG
jgi:hypothetical protein